MVHVESSSITLFGYKGMKCFKYQNTKIYPRGVEDTENFLHKFGTFLLLTQDFDVVKLTKIKTFHLFIGLLMFRSSAF